ncbi:ABC transporter ATP-binding protein [Zoogloea sp.]|uniref:ABC transporter ATP-binding protein n=1 Tax=Zoogloea sp. TaxID=49181 RepID=UPI0025F546C4|nr:ABC transporter ATP-binding protein [Zoogloea sp.]MCK6394777.1 ABC transporter ATP-binding protein [Zoogloea sp.]
MTTSFILSVEDIHVIYNKVILGTRGISLAVPEGRIVALLGANGAGKTTTLKAISGLIGAERGEVTSGRIHFAGRDVLNADPAELVGHGLVQVLEGRHCFAHLDVEENLQVGAFVRGPSRRNLRDSLERIYHYFPRLKERRRSLAGYLSGGEQQMLAIGRALIASPRLVLLDEPSMGLAPQIVTEIFEIVRRLNRDEQVSFVLAEQNAAIALKYSDQAYVLESGRVASAGLSTDLAGRDDIQSFYLGVGADGRRSFRDAKHYHSRRREN